MMEVIRGTVVAFSVRAFGAVLALGFNWLLAKKCGADGAGLYFLALSVLTVGTVIGKLGLDNSLLRFIASNASIHNWKAVKGVYAKGMALALLASGLLSLAVYFLSSNVALFVFHKPELTEPLHWMAIAITPMSFLTLQAEALRGLKRIEDSVLLTGVLIPGFSATVLWFLGNKMGASGATLAYLIGCLLTAFIGLGLWYRAVPQLKNLKGRFRNSDLLKSSMPLFWTSIFETLTNWMSIFILGLWATKSEIGIYGTAFRIAAAVSMILIAVNSISAPKFAALYKKKQIKELTQTVRQTTKLMTLIAGPLLVLFLMFPDFIMGLFGPEFKSGGIILAVLAVGQFVNVITGSVGYLLVMSGNEKLIRNRSVVFAVFSLILNVTLIPLWGLLGAAIATSIGVAATNLVGVYLVNEKLGIWTIPFMPRETING